MKRHIRKIVFMLIFMFILTGCQNEQEECEETEQTETEDETEVSYTEWPNSFGEETDEVLMQLIASPEKGKLVLRSGPSEDFDKVDRIKSGELLDVYAHTKEKDWYGIKYGENYGWVSALEVSPAYDEKMYEQYAQILQDYYDVYMGKSSSEVSELAAIGERYERNLAGAVTLQDPSVVPYFSLCDINGDEKVELFVGGYTWPLDLYRYGKNGAELVKNTGDMSDVALFEDGSIYLFLHAGIMHAESLYRINKEGEVILEVERGDIMDTHGPEIVMTYFKSIGGESVEISEEEYISLGEYFEKQTVSPPMIELTQEQIDLVKQAKVEVYDISDAKPREAENDSQPESPEAKIDVTAWPASFGPKKDVALYQAVADAPDGYVNLRTGAGSDYEIIESIPNGAVLDVYVETDTFTWCGIKYGNNYGWVAVSQIAYIDYDEYAEGDDNQVLVKQRIFSQEEIESIKDQLGVPKGVAATVKIGKTYYWSAAECTITSVEITTATGYAYADVCDDATLGRSILTYQEN